MSVEPMKMNLLMKQLGEDIQGSPEEKKQARLDLFDTLRYFVEDPKEFLEVPKQEPGLMIHYPSLNEEGWNNVKKFVRSQVLPFRAKRFKIDIYDDGTIFFPNIASNNFTMDEFRKKLKELLDYYTQDMRGLEAMSEKAKELGAKVLEMPEIRKEIAKFLPTNRGDFQKPNENAELEYLLSEKEKRATEAQRLQMARQSAMKNEGLEKLIRHIIEQDTYYLMFWDENPMLKVTNGKIDLEIGQTTVAEKDDYQDPADYDGNPNQLNEANKVLEDNEFDSKFVTVSRRFLEFFYDYFKEEEPGTYKLLNEYDLSFVGLDSPLKGNDRKFMLIYLKKKFNITEADIEAKIKENAPRIEAQMKKFEDIMGERKAKLAEKKVKKKEKTKEREAKEEVKATEKALPKGKANAIVLTWKEIKEKFPELKKTGRYDDEKKFKIWLARTNYHMEAVKD